MAADVAMGEPAGKCKPPPPPPPPPSSSPPPSPTKKDKPEKLEWYGFIRLVVFAKPTSPLGAKLFPASEDAVAAGSGGTGGSGGGGSGGGSVVTAVIPCGAKKCGNPTSDWCEVPKAGDPPLLPPYAAGRSPDKGAVAAYFPAARLVVVAAHLNGTNKYGVPEEQFNVSRRAQVTEITRGLGWLVTKGRGTAHGSAYGEACASGGEARAEEERPEAAGADDEAAAALSGCALVVAGDLNFRVESPFTSAEDKAMGGKDWQTVEAVASKGGQEELLELFEKHDLLHEWLEGRGPAPAPGLLRGCVDCVGETLRGACEGGGEQLLRPTFTFGIGASFPRAFKTKRTPSWADRVLARDLGVAMGGAPRLVLCRSLPQVVLSDHEAVVARFEA